jgi:hypothetical protein
MMSLEEFISQLRRIGRIETGRLDRLRELIIKERLSEALRDDFSIIEIDFEATEGTE